MIYADYIVSCLPHFFQKVRFSAWLRSLVSPLQTLYNERLIYAQNVRYRMQLTGQVIYLEHYLNDLFDNAQRRIFISDANDLILPPYLYNKPTPEGSTIYIKNKSEGGDKFYLRNQEEYAGQADFIVNVPSALPVTNSFENQIRAAVNKYKQAGSKYSVVNF